MAALQESRSILVVTRRFHHRALAVDVQNGVLWFWISVQGVNGTGPTLSAIAVYRQLTRAPVSSRRVR